MEAETERTSLLRGPSKSGNKAVKQRHHRRRHHGYDAIKRQEKKESVRIPMWVMVISSIVANCFVSYKFSSSGSTWLEDMSSWPSSSLLSLESALLIHSWLVFLNWKKSGKSLPTCQLKKHSVSKYFDQIVQLFDITKIKQSTTTNTNNTPLVLLFYEYQDLFWYF